MFRSGANQAIALLAIGQTLVWAGLFYTFAAFLLHWETDFGWSKPDLMIAFTLAILTAAAFSPVFGRLIDAGHGKWVMFGGGISGALLLVLLSQTHSQLVFVGVWMAIGATQAACLYEPCFAFVTRVLAGQARAAITRITLVAGFASTLAFPLAAYLAGEYGWRSAVLVFAGIVGLIGAPLLLVGAQALENAHPDRPPVQADGVNKAAVKNALRRLEFWMLAAVFAFIALNHAMIISHVLPLLVNRGATNSQAVAAAMLIGPAQVAGRVVMMGLESRVSAFGVAVTAIAGGCMAAVVLYASGILPVLVFLAALLQGASFGVVSILRPVLVAEVLGRTAFGAIASRVAIPFLVASATAPFIAALLWGIGGYDLVIEAALGFVLIALLCLLALHRRVRSAS